MALFSVPNVLATPLVPLTLYLWYLLCLVVRHCALGRPDSDRKAEGQTPDV